MLKTLHQRWLSLFAVSALIGLFATLSLPALAATGRQCPCPRLLERYRLRGDIGPDWRTWVK